MSSYLTDVHIAPGIVFPIQKMIGKDANKKLNTSFILNAVCNAN